MKTFLINLFLVLLLAGSGSVNAQTWHTANQTTVGWDAVTTLDNGDPMPGGDTISYNVYLRNAITGGDPVRVATGINAVQYTVTLGVEGKYFVGLSAVRVPAIDPTVEIESEIAWTDDPVAVLNGETFGIQYFLRSSTVGGIHIPSSP